MATSISNPLVVVGLGCAGLAAVLLVWFLVRRPELHATTKIVLLLGLGAFPITTAATGNLVGYEASKTRRFCGSCHVMEPWTNDSNDPRSTTLAARHARNPYFGDENCYICHADYGMYGTVTTKLGGLRHVYEFVREYHSLSNQEAVERIKIRHPYPNQNCMQCHSTSAPTWLEVGDHRSLLDELRAGQVSCASAGCHGPAHPFSEGGDP